MFVLFVSQRWKKKRTGKLFDHRPDLIRVSDMYIHINIHVTVLSVYYAQSKELWLITLIIYSIIIYYIHHSKQPTDTALSITFLIYIYFINIYNIHIYFLSSSWSACWHWVRLDKRRVGSGSPHSSRCPKTNLYTGKYI